MANPFGMKFACNFNLREAIAVRDFEVNTEQTPLTIREAAHPLSAITEV